MEFCSSAHAAASRWGQRAMPAFADLKMQMQHADTGRNWDQDPVSVASGIAENISVPAGFGEPMGQGLENDQDFGILLHVASH